MFCTCHVFFPICKSILTSSVGVTECVQRYEPATKLIVDVVFIIRFDIDSGQ